jgi:mannosyltransferase OCH1-like enzyme
MTPLIHRVWIGELPSKDYCTEFINSVNNTFPSFEQKMWGLENSQRFMKEKFPEWEERLWKKDMKYFVVKSDVIRYCILREFGGIYTDLDFEVIDSTKFKKLVNGNSFVVCTELETDKEFCQKTKTIPIRNGIPEDTTRIASYFFYCEPHHVIWDFIFEEMLERFDRVNSFDEDYDVIYATGPDLISTVVNKNKKDFGLRVLSVKECECVKHHFYGSKTWKAILKENEVGYYGKFK